jgi:hypothetical protein
VVRKAGTAAKMCVSKLCVPFGLAQVFTVLAQHRPLLVAFLLINLSPTTIINLLQLHLIAKSYG